MRLDKLVLFACAAITCVGPVLASSPGLDLRFERLNGVYEDLEAVVEPIRSGPLAIYLTSPSHRLEMKDHGISLSPLGNGRHRLRGSVRFLGEGILNARLDFGGIPASLEDEVEFPEQSRQIEAKVFIEVVDEGYRVTAEELPAFVDVEARSRLGSELVAWCGRLALFIGGDAGCSTLDRQLTRPRLPLPAPGASYTVRAEDLTSEERDRIGLYLTRFPAPVTPPSRDPR